MTYSNEVLAYSHRGEFGMEDIEGMSKGDTQRHRESLQGETGTLFPVCM